MFKVVRENVLTVNEDRKSQQHRNINYKNEGISRIKKYSN